MASWLELLVEDVRLYINDPVTGKTFTDTQILRWAGMAARTALRDIQAISSAPVALTWDYSVTAGTTVIPLPPSVGEVLRYGKWNADGEFFEWFYKPRSRFHPIPNSLRLNGRRFTADATIREAFTLRTEYVPNFDFSPHEGARSFTPDLLTTTQFALVEPASETADLDRGVIDNRNGAYVGSRLRVWSESDAPAVVQERTIVDYVVDKTATGKTRLLTLDSPFDSPLTQNGSHTYHYEVVPLVAESHRQLIMVGTFLAMAPACSLEQRIPSAFREYQRLLRTEKLADAYANPHGQTWEHDTTDAYRGGF